jgi:hypothetical protein
VTWVLFGLEEVSSGWRRHHQTGEAQLTDVPPVLLQFGVNMLSLDGRAIMARGSYFRAAAGGVAAA